MNYIKKNLAKISGMVGVFAMAMLAMAKNTYAAADATLTDAIASSTSFFTDNLSVIMTFVIENVFKLAGAVLGLLAIYWIIRKIKSLFRR